MSAEEIIAKYKQLTPSAKQQVEELIERLTGEVPAESQKNAFAIRYLEGENSDVA